MEITIANWKLAVKVSRDEHSNSKANGIDAAEYEHLLSARRAEECFEKRKYSIDLVL